MTSINFNAAANSALRTLQSTNTSLNQTQNRISTGLKIGEAKDNAAYWSISTTLKSDNKAMATVKDALSLGAATVDTAYQGLNSTLDVLNDIKSKLVAASQDGVDKGAIQSEINELQKQLKSIATSSTFSGENWLSVDSSAGLIADKSIVSSFTRGADGSVSIDTVKVDTSSFVLVDANAAAEGVLDAGKIGNTAVNGLDAWTASSNTPASGALVSVDITGYTAADGNLIGKVTVSGTDYNFNIAVDTTAHTADDLDLLRAAILAGAVNSAGQALSSVAVGGATGTLDFRSTATGSAQTISVNISGANSGIGTGLTAGDDGVDQSRSTVSDAFGGTAIDLDRNDTIAMSVTVNGTAKNFSITRSAVDAALGAAANGTISNAQQYASVINKAIEQAGITGISATADGAVAGSKVTLIAKNSSTLVSAAAVASKGTSILNIDITNADKAALTNFINAVSDAANSITSAAATLGAVGARIDLQKTFVQNLMDTIDKGVSGLVDADMNEESTKLQALQVKQQLGVQALSIANQSAQNVLSLFRS